MIESHLLQQIGLMIISATIVAHFARILKQPLIIGYILAGIIIGPAGLKLITNDEVIRTLSELGIAFLLFIVGVELDISKLRSVGMAATSIAVVQTIAIGGIGFFLSMIVGLTTIQGVYMGLILSFSSTMIVIKLLSDKNELETLHGRIILGILLVEDVIAILALSVLSTLEGAQSISAIPIEEIFHALIMGAGLFSIAFVASRFVLPSLFHMIEHSHELLFATALSVFFIFTYLSTLVGLSIAIGAFMAGVAIATFPYGLEIKWKVHSLRDFFVILFFVSLGMEIWFGDLITTIMYAVPFTIITILIKPVIIMITTSFFRYGRRVSFLTAASLAQISEFSLIVGMTGLSLNHLTPQLFSIVALISVFTFIASGYLIKYDNIIYKKIAGRLTPLESMSHHDKTLMHCPDDLTSHGVLIGAHRMGYAIIKIFEDLNICYVVMDFNPDIVKYLAEEGKNVIYGDIGDLDALQKLRLETADIVVSSVVDEEDSLLLIKEAKERNPKITLFLTSDNVENALRLYDAGADYVLVPKLLSGVITGELIEEHLRDSSKLSILRENHIQELEEIERDELLKRYEPSFLKHLEQRIDGHIRRHKAGEQSIRVIIEDKET